MKIIMFVFLGSMCVDMISRKMFGKEESKSAVTAGDASDMHQDSSSSDGLHNTKYQEQNYDEYNEYAHHSSEPASGVRIKDEKLG